MSGIVKLRYTPLLVGAGETVSITSDTVGGFLATATGTITITRNNDNGTTTVVVNAVPVTTGLWTEIPFYLGKNGGSVTSGAGAVGTLGV